MKGIQILQLDPFPHCAISHPVLNKLSQSTTVTHDGMNRRQWTLYACNSCGGATLTVAHNWPQVSPIQEITDFWPKPEGTP